jgi:hypothetical protein
MERFLGGTSDRQHVTFRRLTDSADGAPAFLETDCTVLRDPATHAPDVVVVVAGMPRLPPPKAGTKASGLRGDVRRESEAATAGCLFRKAKGRPVAGPPFR